MDADRQRQQDIVQGGAHYLCVKWPHFLMLNAGQDSNIFVVYLKSLNPQTKIVGAVRSSVLFVYNFIDLINYTSGGPSSILFIGERGSFPEVKRPGREVDH